LQLRQHKLGRILDFQVKRESAATVARAVAKAEAGGLTALHIAAAVGWLELVVKLIEVWWLFAGRTIWLIIYRHIAL
jgi:hypothetical protein